jgi:HEAT repeat protein
MTMKTILTAAAIISSAGFGASHSPASHPSFNSPVAAFSLAGANLRAELRFAALDRLGDPLPPAPWATADPADSLYRVAREALSRGDYKRAAEIFHQIPERYPQSAYAGQALYYEAFALYRSGGDDDLGTARERLTQLQQRFPAIAKSDGASLLTRVCGELAKRGDESCAASIDRTAEEARAAAEAAARVAQGDSGISGRATSGSQGRSCPSEDDGSDQMAALSALIQMDPDRAIPILQKVLARRDACSAALRRKAVFLVSQKRTDQTANILMNVARTDPDQETREQAVFWLSQVPGSTPLLEEILKDSGDEGVKDKALFSLSQQGEPRAQQALRDFAMRESENADLRDKAIFWLGQRRSPENTAFLRTLYSRLTNQDLKEKVLFSLSQQKGAGNEQWLMDIAVNPREDIDLRKKALFWAGQTGVATSELSNLYNRMTDTDVKDYMIFVFSQRQSDPAAMDKLFDIAKNEKVADLRKKAIFWLGQSHDPRVQQFLLDLINR